MIVPQLQHGERTSTTNETLPSLVPVQPPVPTPIPPSPVDLDSSNQTSLRVNLNDTPSSFNQGNPPHSFHHPFNQTYPMQGRSPPTPTTPPFPVRTSFHQQHHHRYNTPPQSTPYPIQTSHQYYRKPQVNPQHGTLPTPPSSPPYLHQQ
eukprot:PhF_6_TR31879/c0_g2_i1/m.47371